MSKPLFILDLDRTIFDTSRFFEDIKAALHRTHRLDINEFTNTYNAFIEPQVGYDPHGHHGKLLGLTPDQLDEVIKQELDDRDYAFPDAAAWLEQHHEDDVVVITMGRPRYQELKFHHCAPVRDLPKIVVATNKGLVIRRHIEGRAGEYDLSFLDTHDHITLIDDSVDTFTALGQAARITGIRIARPGQKWADLPTPPGIRHITSFGELS
jgi:FMN phosphatase YigB (HAD superfamily)